MIKWQGTTLYFRKRKAVRIVIFGKHINRYYLKYFPAMLLGILSLIAVDIAQLKIPEYYRMLIDGMDPSTAFSLTWDFLLDGICLPMLLIIAIIVAGRFLWRVCLLGSAVKVETDLRSEMFFRAKDLSQQYYQVHKVGDLMSLFTNDLETIQDSFGFGVLTFCDMIVLGSLSIYKMFRMHGVLTLLAVIPLALLLASSFIVGRYMEKKWDERQAAFSELSDFAQESFSGIAVIKAFVKECKELLAFRKINRRNENANVAFTKASTLLNICVTLFVESVIAIILGYGGTLVYRGTFNAGQLVEFIGYFTSAIWPIMAVSEMIDMRSRGKASLKRISELLDAEPDVRDRADVGEIPPIRGDIEFCDLTFRYPGAEYDALKHVSFSIKAGENIGVIGRTGSGKTTVVDLLLRTYNVPDGTVFVDGRDVNSFPIRRLRQYTAYVPQDNFLFSDTVANNIAFASDSDDRALVKKAAVSAAVDQNIEEFPQKYDTVLGERGVTVSGGQKQRISIARALMKDASILILDDSVSAVDTATERAILTALREERRGKTTILIAHRVSTVMQMDRILLIDDGEVLGFGTHEELMRTSPEYRRTVDLQRLEDERETKGGEARA